MQLKRNKIVYRDLRTPDECGRQWSNCIYHANGGYSPCDTLEGWWCRVHEHLLHPRQCGQKILNRLEFFHSLRKKAENLIVGVYWDVWPDRWKRTDWKTSCRLISRSGCLPWPSRPGAVEAEKSHQCGTFYYELTVMWFLHAYFAGTISQASFPSCEDATISAINCIVPYTRTGTQPWRGKYPWTKYATCNERL